jgi:hypothetical protein
MKLLEEKKIKSQEWQWQFAEDIIKDIASCYTMPGVSWNIEEVSSLITDENKEILIVINKVKSAGWSKTVGQWVSSSKKIPGTSWNIWIIECDKSDAERVSSSVIKLYSNEGVWEGTFTSRGTVWERRKKYIESLSQDANSLLSSSCRFSSSFSFDPTNFEKNIPADNNFSDLENRIKKLLGIDKNTDLPNNWDEFLVKKSETKRLLKNYEVLMKDAVSDCKEIIKKEENSSKKKEYENYQEEYEAEIMQVNNITKNWK